MQLLLLVLLVANEETVLSAKLAREVEELKRQTLETKKELQLLLKSASSSFGRREDMEVSLKPAAAACKGRLIYVYTLPTLYITCTHRLCMALLINTSNLRVQIGRSL